MTVSVRPITDADIDPVADFLQVNMTSGVSARTWRQSLTAPRNTPKPNNGFLLLDGKPTGEPTGEPHSGPNGTPADQTGERIVGAYLAYYSNRNVHGKPEQFCNLGAWCVLPDYRFHSVRLLKALLAQNGLHFVDLSPSGNVVALNQRLGFEFLDTSTALAPTFAWPWRSATVSTDPTVIERTLTGHELQLYLDHRDSPAVTHVVLRRPRSSNWCYVVFRMDRRRKLPRVFASILHVSDPQLFRRLHKQFRGYLLLRHRALAVLAELRVVENRPPASVMVSTARRKMYRSATLPAQEIDYFYSELVSVPW